MQKAGFVVLTKSYVLSPASSPPVPRPSHGEYVPMITVQHEGNLTIIGIFARLEIADFKRLEDEIESQLKGLGKIDLLVDLRGMLGYTLDVALEDLRFSRAHARDVGRVAILSEDDSMMWTALLSELFVRAEIRVFDDETVAREWLARVE